MATDQEPQITDDGIQEVPLTKARPLLTRLIEQLREDGLVSALTVRGRRRVYLVTPDFYDQAVSDRRLARAFRQAMGDLPPEERDQQLLTAMARHVMEVEERS